MIRSQRGSLRKAFLLIALVSLLLLPFQAYASKGSALRATVDELIPTASPGQLVAFSASFHNDTTTSMPHFAFSGTAQGATFDSFYPSDENCTGSGSSVSCQFGTLAADGRKDLVLVFKVSNNATVVTFTGTFTADSTTKSGKGGSKRDSWSDSASVGVNSSGDFLGTWQPPGKAGVFGPFGVGQKTKVETDPHGNSYVARIQQIESTSECTGGPGWGKTVDMQVADGNQPVEVTITFERQPGLTPQVLRIMHIYEEAGLTYCREVLPASDCKTSTDTCFVAYWEGNGNNRKVEAFIRLPHTSRAKGF